MSLPIRDIHLPEAPSIWPPAIGWWLVAIVLMLLLLGVFTMLRQHRKKKAIKQRLLMSYDKAIAAASSQEQKLQLASQYLRRTCLKHAPHAAHLANEAWLAFLDQSHGGSDYFSRGEGALLRNGPFQPHLDAHSVDSVVHEVRQVIHALVTHHA